MFSISTFAESLHARKGFRRYAAAFAFGCIGALAYAPTNMFWVLWICFPSLLFLLQGAPNLRSAFLTGWSFAFGNFVVGLYWIAASMFVDIVHFWWAVPLSVAGLPAFFSFYYGAATVLAWRVGLRGISGTISFALLWFLADYARGHCFTGFPWNLEGYAWNGILPVMQLTSITGIYGLTLLTVIAACLAALLAEKKKSHVAVFTSSLVLLCLIAAWGMERLSRPATMTTAHVRIVQPNVDQVDKWIASEREEHFQSLLSLSSAPSDKPLNAIIWPETASTFYLAEDAYHRHVIATEIPNGTPVITGVIRREQDALGIQHYYNSLVAIDHDAQIMTGYDKFHLVPFGEYIPVRKILPLRTLANLGIDFTAGDGPHTLRFDGIPPFSPLICYEAIFPGEVSDRKDRPQLLINVTNDGWYARTAGPYQHFATARVRAIEEGLPLARSANTGISGMIDPYGRILSKLKLGATGFVDSKVPAALTPTIFSRTGETVLWVLFGIGTLGAALTRKWR
jgi:apolipoprotein N-acyltransferase